jgi:hypothetical protein
VGFVFSGTPAVGFTVYEGLIGILSSTKLTHGWRKWVAMTMFLICSIRCVMVKASLHVAATNRVFRLPRRTVSASGNWRITFGWIEGDAIDVDLEDYH